MWSGSLCSPWFTSSVAKEKAESLWLLLIRERKHRKPHRNTINLPAPTPWPIVLAFGITLLFAGLVTSAFSQHSRSDPDRDRMCRLVPGRSPARKEETMEVKAEVQLWSPLPAAKSKGCRLHQIFPGPASARNISSVSGNQRRPRRQCGHGGARMPLRLSQARKHLVSDQSAGSDRLRSIPPFRYGIARRHSIWEAFSWRWSFICSRHC